MGYVLDIDAASFHDPAVAQALGGPGHHFRQRGDGLHSAFHRRFPGPGHHHRRQPGRGNKLYGGGDTLQEFKDLCPGLYLSVLDDAQYYFFTGGGSVLKAIEQRSPYGLEPVTALMENARKNNHNGT